MDDTALMGHYRPPRPKGSPYITAEGAQALRDELQYLWHDERPKVTSDVSEAAKLGDRSENGDYIYGKKRLREIDRRITYLTKRLDQLVVVDQVPDDETRVYFAAYVTVEDDEGVDETYRIVGVDEADPNSQNISVDSPLARALIGKYLDDVVTITTPTKTTEYEIIAIEYR